MLIPSATNSLLTRNTNKSGTNYASPKMRAMPPIQAQMAQAKKNAEELTHVLKQGQEIVEIYTDCTKNIQNKIASDRQKIKQKADADFAQQQNMQQQNMQQQIAAQQALNQPYGQPMYPSQYSDPYNGQLPYQQPYGMPYQQPYGMPYQQPYGMPYQQPYGMPYQQPYEQSSDKLLEERIKKIFDSQQKENSKKSNQ
jgi:hypothetical protein